MPIRMLRVRLLAGLVAALVAAPGGRAGAQMVSAPVLEPIVAPPASTTTLGGQSATLVPTTLALQITTPLTLFYGEAINGLAQVTTSDGSVATGNVVFYDGTRAFCTLPLTNGASCTGNASAVFDAGTHVFTAVYSGDATHAGSTSNAVTVVVKQDATATSLASSVNPVTAGGSVVYAAVVQGAHGQAEGVVQFQDGGSVIGQATMDSSGTASLAVLMMTPGTHAITAVYVGTANLAASTSAVLNEVVTSPAVASTTTIASSANPVAVGASVSFTARVSAGAKTATGTVTFVEGGTVLGSAVLDGTGTAVWTTSALGVGAHSIVAQYAGDAAVAASTSAALVETVTAAAASDGFTLGLSQVTVNAGDTAEIPVVAAAGSSFAKAMTVSCAGLPDEASCTYVSGTVRIATAGPRDCGTTTPYAAAGLPLAGPVLAGLLVIVVPRRRRAWKGLLAVICAVMVVGSVSGCGTGNCTDLGSRPGTYTVAVTGSAGGATVVQKVQLVVKP